MPLALEHRLSRTSKVVQNNVTVLARMSGDPNAYRSQYPGIVERENCHLRALCRVGPEFLQFPLELVENDSFLEQLEGSLFLADVNGNLISRVGPEQNIQKLPISGSEILLKLDERETSERELVNYLRELATLPARELQRRATSSMLAHILPVFRGRSRAESTKSTFFPCHSPPPRGVQASESRWVTAPTHRSPLQPTKKQSRRVRVPKVTSSQRLYIAALVPEEERGQYALSPPIPVLTVALIILLCIAGALPLLKLELLRASQPLRGRDVWSAAIAAVFLFGLLTIAPVDFAIYYSVTNETERAAEQIARDVRSKLEAEVAALTSSEFLEQAPARIAGSREDVRCLEDWRGAQQAEQSPPPCALRAIVALTEAGEYFRPDRTVNSCSGSDGGNLAERTYFRAAKQGQWWPQRNAAGAEAPGAAFPPRFLDVIRSMSTGDLIWGAALPATNSQFGISPPGCENLVAADGARRASDIGTLVTFEPRNLSHPILPIGFSLAIVRQGEDFDRGGNGIGEVLYHNVEERALAEKMMYETDGSARLGTGLWPSRGLPARECTCR